MAADAIKKHHVVRLKHGGGTGVVQWVGKHGNGERAALVRWDDTGVLAVLPCDLLKVEIIRLGAYDRLGYETPTPKRSAGP